MASTWRESPRLRSYRELLGVSAQDGIAEIKKAFRKRARLYHPDVNPHKNAQREFDKILKAYEVLSDPLRVAEMNRNYVKESLLKPCVPGLNICFGSLFGYRHFFERSHLLVEKALRIGREVPGEKDVFDDGAFYKPLQENNSILDDPAFDAIELVYAGRHSSEDEALLVDKSVGKEIFALPWVLLNNQGVVSFLERDFPQTLKCYQELNRRVPNNIIFMYREAICRLVMAFDSPETHLLGRRKPNSIEVAKGTHLLQQCLKLATQRPVGRQKALIIRKTLAEVYEKTGKRLKARRLWREIYQLDTDSIEAAFKVQGRVVAAKLYTKKISRLSPNPLKLKDQFARG